MRVSVNQSSGHSCTCQVKHQKGTEKALALTEMAIANWVEIILNIQMQIVIEKCQCCDYKQI